MKMCNCALPQMSPLGVKICENCINRSEYDANIDYFECEPMQSFAKSTKKMMLLEKERYDELIEIEAMYKDLCR